MLLQVRPGLGFGTFMNVTSLLSAGNTPSNAALLTISFIIDIMFDDLFVLHSEEVCRVLDRMRGQVTKEELKCRLEEEVGGRGRKVSRIVDDLLQSGVVLPVTGERS